LTWE